LLISVSARIVPAVSRVAVWWVSPALTSVRVDAEAHGRQAARAILGLDAADLSPAPGRVVVRESA
jgi:DNA-binding LacI/PurR family transcriptional regulator